MLCMINGKELDVPTRDDGTIDVDAIKKAAGISPDRLVIRQNRDGSNQVVNPGDEICARPGDHYMDGPIHKNGG
ncbi:MAG: hypothetical protein KAV82_01520 [Phycisphaerae bacterium]|nr:hypothetical protein [Phycisphaerae bacterium]